MTLSPFGRFPVGIFALMAPAVFGKVPRASQSALNRLFDSPWDELLAEPVLREPVHNLERFRRMLELTKHIPIGENTTGEKQEIVEKQEINENQKDEKKSDVKLFYISSDEIRAGLWKNLNPKSAKTGEGLIDWLKREKREREAPPAPPTQTAPPAPPALPAPPAPP
eukprot:g63916.t1